MNIIAFLLFIILIGSIWLFLSVTPVLSILFLLISLTMAVSLIFKKHKASENPHSKIAKDVLILVITILLIIFFSGLAGLIANSYASSRFGAVVGFVAAIIASFLVGYMIKTGMGKFIKSAVDALLFPFFGLSSIDVSNPKLQEGPGIFIASDKKALFDKAIEGDSN